jgi:hypothetical protein
MKVKTILATTAFALAGWFAMASASPLRGPAQDGARALSGYQLAQDEHHEMGHGPMIPAEPRPDHDEWYQGQRGRWYRDHDHWRWHGAKGDDWYQGQRGHWYNEPNGWQFGTDGLICNNQGRNCRPGGFLRPNGEGMVSRANPNMFWHCDADGHNCRWARRPR